MSDVSLTISIFCFFDSFHFLLQVFYVKIQPNTVIG